MEKATPPFDKFIGMPYYHCCDEIQELADTEHKILEIKDEGNIIIDVEPERVTVWLNEEGFVSQVTFG